MIRGEMAQHRQVRARLPVMPQPGAKLDQRDPECRIGRLNFTARRAWISPSAGRPLIQSACARAVSAGAKLGSRCSTGRRRAIAAEGSLRASISARRVAAIRCAGSCRKAFSRSADARAHHPAACAAAASRTSRSASASGANVIEFAARPTLPFRAADGSFGGGDGGQFLASDSSRNFAGLGQDLVFNISHGLVAHRGVDPLAVLQKLPENADPHAVAAKFLGQDVGGHLELFAAGGGRRCTNR